MTARVHFIIRFYGPIFVAVIFMFLTIFIPEVLKNSHVSMGADFEVLWIFKVPLDFWFDKETTLRLLFTVGAFCSVLVSLTTDFSKFFPKQMSMDVYFDTKGIEDTLSMFGRGSLDDLPISKNWRELVSIYNTEVEKGLSVLRVTEHIPDLPALSDFPRDMIHAKGSTTFFVERVSPISYRIMGSTGQLEIGLDVPKFGRKYFRSEFHLRETSANHIRPSFLDIFFKREIVLKPEFKQVFTTFEPSANAPFDHVVIGLTKIILIPLPEFSNSLYLWRNSDGNLVPIAYAIYY
jgi:hypothetical protein